MMIEILQCCIMFYVIDWGRSSLKMDYTHKWIMILFYICYVSFPTQLIAFLGGADDIKVTGKNLCKCKLN